MDIQNHLKYFGVIFFVAGALFFYYRENPTTTNTSTRDERFQLAILTDIDHCPSRAPVSSERIQQFLLDAQKRAVDAVVSLGDNASHRLGDCSETADEDARFIVDTLRSTPLPAYFALGDHDIASSQDSYRYWLDTIQRDSTYFSFEKNGVHVVVLDTVLGGEPLSPSCEELTDCATLQAKLVELGKTNSKERETVMAALEEKENEIKLTRSSGWRDRGRISEKQLAWLAEDIQASSMDKVVVLSDHPLFDFTSRKKRYNIMNGEKVRDILEKSGKQVVALSGEAHVWHEETRKGVQYYIVNEFRQDNGSWAFFSWTKEGYSLEQVAH